jgi:sugar lactone lactonase YvrE
VEVPAGAGGPDGIAMDADGGIWVALFDGGRVHRYTPDGRLDTVVELPVTNVTACAFGGPDLRDLYITTATFGLDAEGLARQPLAGALFVARPGQQGRPARRFAG